ncbi:phosphonoacetaldehyde hydrolase [Metabacillus indicus]|uniref:phosphonoacetaldehyde hydrolase n=1 Tax=Metabacillus indicus TaxID=246786 RepID=UPI002A071BF1|nr:phosphonoacetaldehyde hydrolase [Metabacillus indicus]MDX8289193.1 phosphonoacetaldehyde hydrolase [Metabacillus indicus]
MKNIQGLILDWAGTTVDYGCFAPLQVFIEVFKNRDITITAEEARRPMGLLKIDHIRALCDMPRINREWISIHGNEPSEQDIQEMYKEFEKTLFEILPNFTTPLPGVVQTVQKLREKGLKIGSSTGYTKEMMKIVAPYAKEKGYQPDFLFTPDDVKAGRPYPWMAYMNAMELDIYPMNRLLKAGDTVSDIEEGINAGMITVGIILGSNELGLTEEEVQAMDLTELNQKMETVKKRFLKAGAHYVINEFSDLIPLLEELEKGDMRNE